MLHFVFFLSYGDHRDLHVLTHSFPARRSSDLELRSVCLGLPEAVEVEAWGRPTFRAGKKIFAVFSGTDERPYGVIFKPEGDERVALVQDERFYAPPYFGPSGWLALDLEIGRAHV